ncbi:MAG TPA: GAF domain-containing protein [Methylovirgula sp.]|nr:GAF domain-containing protein [Methylovirgula sp.]
MKHADSIFAIAQDPMSSSRSLLYASWVRSLNRYGLDPGERGRPRSLSATELRQAQERTGKLLHVAQSGLDGLFQAVGGAGCCVLFTDGQGIPVDRRGHCADDATFFDWGLWTGTDWSERSEGTNGIGTCLAEKRALTIHRDQHFHTRNTGLSCTVAPIYDHLGRLAAALDVSSCRSDLAEPFLPLIAAAVADAARKIEMRYFREAFTGARIILAPETDLAAAALLAVNSDDVVIGATRNARAALQLKDENMGRLSAADLLKSRAFEPKEALERAERRVLNWALAQSHNNVARAARLLGVSRATMHRKIAKMRSGAASADVVD